ncbi:uncharacterized protein DUF4190 [Salsuginibacillus halophilus]|uniref:Uncharacterized protein DUF4190 n=1 Tax=Salsuginibacillus halophilus TaxID=517424 RepID=A0A2P8H9N4_9BACI|nr:DUF4190 domain-containing protein [Salsuginibacillus halophilus]PSL42935.1 uncharacterized protein DUF4190 [Salsuginibacillus halophilus]
MSSTTAKPPVDTKAVTSLVCGLLALLTGALGLALPILGILGLGFGAVSLLSMRTKQKSGRALALAGTAASVIGLGLLGLTI